MLKFPLPDQLPPASFFASNLRNTCGPTAVAVPESVTRISSRTKFALARTLSAALGLKPKRFHRAAVRC